MTAKILFSPQAVLAAILVLLAVTLAMATVVVSPVSAQPVALGNDVKKFALLETESALSSPTISQADIDSALASGPVLVEVDGRTCPHSKKQRPVTQVLQGDYPGKVTFFYVLTDQNPDLTDLFDVTGTPTMVLIVGKDASGYQYMSGVGEVTSDVDQAKFSGEYVNQRAQDKLRNAINAAVSYRGQRS